PRKGWVSTSLGIWSDWVDDFAEHHQLQRLLAHRVPVSKIEQVSTATGAVLGRLTSNREYCLGIRVAPDGKHLACVGGYGPDSRVSWIDTTIGWPHRSVTCRMNLDQIGNHPIVGFDGERSDLRVFFACSDTAANQSLLMAWRPTTGTLETVIAEPGHVDAR